MSLNRCTSQVEASMNTLNHDCLSVNADAIANLKFVDYMSESSKLPKS